MTEYNYDKKDAIQYTYDKEDAIFCLTIAAIWTLLFFGLGFLLGRII